MEQTNNNPRTQGFKEGTRVSFASFLANAKASGKSVRKVLVKERTNRETGEVIPEHHAICLFVAKKGSDGKPLVGANGGPIAEQGTMEYVSIGPSVGESTPASDIVAIASELEVGELQSGTLVLFKPNYNGILGEEL